MLNLGYSRSLLCFSGAYDIGFNVPHKKNCVQIAIFVINWRKVKKSAKNPQFGRPKKM